LRSILDGRDFLARTAEKVGLIDGVASEGEAYQNLLNLVGNDQK
jgi:hypothetical protein